MSKRRLDALRARMELGSTEGERRAAARAYEIHSKKATTVTTAAADEQRHTDQRNYYDDLIRDWFNSTTAASSRNYTRCPKCGTPYPISRFHECSRVGSPRTKAGPFRPQPPPPSAEQKRATLLHENTEAIMGLARAATAQNRRITAIIEIVIDNGELTWSVQTEPAE